MTRTLLTTLLGLALLAPGCVAPGKQGEPLIPTKYRTRTGPFVISTSYPLAPDSPPVQNLIAVEDRVRTTLGLEPPPDGPPIEVYVLSDRSAFEHFLKFYYPELPPRRAFFLAQGDRRVVYTFLGERLDEDLRHEATHALLNAAIADLPLWLDEGLAEYFEGPPGRWMVNGEHLGRLPRDLAAGWRPDLRRLEGLRDVGQMTPRDYRESWAWVHYLLNGPEAGRGALFAYLNDLRRGAGGARPLSERLAATASPQLVTHLERLLGSPVLVATPSREATVRLQDVEVEPARSPARRRGILGRLRDWLGLGSGSVTPSSRSGADRSSPPG